MTIHSLRTALRHHTGDVHRRLDEAAGELRSLEQYRGFLVSSYRFRSVVEPACTEIDFWSIQLLRGHLALDLHDLGVAPPTGALPPMHLPTRSAALGALYVLEGSALGARLLLRRAAALGLDEHRGARHLARQVADGTRWSRFLPLLDEVADIDKPEVLAAAQAVFERAAELYAEPTSERV